MIHRKKHYLSKISLIVGLIILSGLLYGRIVSIPVVRELVVTFTVTSTPISTPTSTLTPTSTPTLTPTPLPKIERVLIISYDGMRPDAIEKAPMPNLLKLMDTGAYAPTSAETIAYPATLPSHAAMLSGLCTRENGIFLNRYFKYMGYSKGVDIFDLAHSAGMRTVMIVGKDKLRQIAEPETTDVFEIRYDEKAIGNVAVEEIAKDFGLMFVHFPNADKIGHKYGWMNYGYLRILTHGDEALGDILTALDENGLRETTLIIVTADHGGHGEDHIGTTIQDYRIPWIINGLGIVRGELNIPIQTMDTAATAAYALGLPLQSNWQGIPVYEAFGQPRLKEHPPVNQHPCHE